MIVERFWRLTFLPSLRLLVASHLAFKICFFGPMFVVGVSAVVGAALFPFLISALKQPMSR